MILFFFPRARRKQELHTHPLPPQRVNQDLSLGPDHVLEPNLYDCIAHCVGSTCRTSSEAYLSGRNRCPARNAGLPPVQIWLLTWPARRYMAHSQELRLVASRVGVAFETHVGQNVNRQPLKMCSPRQAGRSSAYHLRGLIIEKKHRHAFFQSKLIVSSTVRDEHVFFIVINKRTQRCLSGSHSLYLKKKP